MRKLVLAMSLVLGFLSIGCDNGVKQEEIKIQPQGDMLAEVKSLLNTYANGQALGSEGASFPYKVTELRKIDPAKADIVEKCFEALQKKGANTKTIAKETLEKLK
jgi:hypothetical protein